MTLSLESHLKNLQLINDIPVRVHRYSNEPHPIKITMTPIINNKNDPIVFLQIDDSIKYISGDPTLTRWCLYVPTSNFDIGWLLEQYRMMAELDDEPYRERAYRMAGNTIVNDISFIISIATIDRLKSIKHVGQGIAERIIEYLLYGTLSGIDLDKLAAMKTLFGILGVGSVAAKVWIKNGIRTISQLKDRVGDGTIILNRMQTIGLTYYDNLTKRIPRSIIMDLSKQICSSIKLLNGRENTSKCIVAGSYRRGLATSGDIDILIERQNTQTMDNIVQMIEAMPIWAETIMHGAQRSSFICKTNSDPQYVQVDILCIDSQSYWAALLYFTGSWQHNERIRGIAKAKGYKLNQYGLFKNGNPITITSEEHLYTILGLEYVEPQCRIK